MDPRTQLITYMEEMAARNVDIAHTLGAERGANGRRFYLELSYDVLSGPDEKPDSTGWNLVMMGYESSMDDNKHGRRIERVPLIFDVIKHVSKVVDEVAMQALYAEAREIGEELLMRFEEHTKNPCAAFDAGAISSDALVPYSLVLGSKRTIEIGPRYDAMHGYRFMVDVLMDAGVKKASTPSKWRTLP